VVFNTDFTLQAARDHQETLLVSRGPRHELVRPSAGRQRIGAWIVRIGLAVEGRAPVHSSRAWQG
jgi:hypothetical protein